MKTRNIIVFCCLIVLSISRAWGDHPSVDSYNVVWSEPRIDSRDSMPLGNGDLGLNVWVEKDGDLLFYISNTDAWTVNVLGSKGIRSGSGLLC